MTVQDTDIDIVVKQLVKNRNISSSKKKTKINV